MILFFSSSLDVPAGCCSLETPHTTVHVAIVEQETVHRADEETFPWFIQFVPRFLFSFISTLASCAFLVLHPFYYILHSLLRVLRWSVGGLLVWFDKCAMLDVRLLSARQATPRQRGRTHYYNVHGCEYLCVRHCWLCKENNNNNRKRKRCLIGGSLKVSTWLVNITLTRMLLMAFNVGLWRLLWWSGSNE